MSRGPRITEKTERHIMELYIENPDWTKKKLQLELDREMAGKGPGISAIYKALPKKDKSKKTPDGQQEGLESPWMLGASAEPEYRIPPEANRELLYIWRWCVVVGRTFTIREAQWVARLRGVVPLESLLMSAVDYSLREQACEALKQPLYTADLDAEMAFKERTGWPYHTASRIGAIDTYVPRSHKERETWEAGENLYLTLMIWPANWVVESYLGLGHSDKLPEDAGMVYAMWLRHLSKGPRWQNLSKEAKEGIAQRLYEEVAEKIKEIEDLSSQGPWWWQASLKSMEWKPSQELFTEVGIDVTKTSKEE